jgi:tetratricopeptide (TPR) repeat protein
MIDRFNILNAWEKQIICSLSILPNQSLTIPDLCGLFLIEETEQVSFFDTIHDLSIKGFLDREKASYKINPAIAENIINEIKPGIEECPRIIKQFSDKLELPKLANEKCFYSIYDQIAVLLERIKKDNLHLAHLSYLLSSNLIRYNNYKEALKYNELAVEISEKIDKTHPLVALFYRDKAYIHRKLGNSKKAICYNLKDIEILELQGGKYDELLTDSYYAISKTYESIRNFDKALEYNLKAIKFEKKKNTNNSSNLSGLYQNLANYYSKLNNLQHASLSINKAVESYTDEKNKSKIHYIQLIKDQKKFNSLYEIELLIKKFKYPILILIGFLFGTFLWILYNIIV